MKTITYDDAFTIINFFNVAEPLKSTEPVSMKKYGIFVDMGLRTGYLVHPACCTEVVFRFLSRQEFNPNATFWKEWSDIVDRSQTELWIHAFIHYFTTYGTNFSLPAYVPNDNMPDVDLFIPQLKIISPATSVEIAQKCYETIRSGIALKSDNVQTFCRYIDNAVESGQLSIDINTVANREAQCILGVDLKEFSKDPITCLRQLVYMATGETLLIKSDNLIRKLSAGAHDNKVDMTAFSDDMLKSLASIFYRFKPLFLAMKNYEPNASVINKIRRYAVKFHKPLRIGILESVLDPKWTDSDLEKALSAETNIFKLFRLHSYMSSELLTNKREEFLKTYNIRNGKVWTRTFQPVNQNTINQYQSRIIPRLQLVTRRIIALLAAFREKTGKKTVMLPKNINLACPVSEKLFVGDVPYGSYFQMTRNNYFGVYWRNEWGTRDYDLHFINHDSHFGWNSQYKDEEDAIIFSGDMTNADPEATEMFYCKEWCPDGVIKLSRFRGEPGSRARLFFGQDKIEELPCGYMVNPNSIKFTNDIFPIKREITVGAILENKCYFISAESGNSRVADSTLEFDGMKDKIQSYLLLESVLKNAGFTLLIPDKPLDEEVEIDYDFTYFNRGQIISFFNDVIKSAKE